VGAGYYLGWYSIGAQADSQGHKEIKIQVNASQVVDDINKGEQKVAKVLQNQGVGTGTVPSTTLPPPPPPPSKLPGLPPSTPAVSEQQWAPSTPNIPQNPEQWLPPSPPPSPPADEYDLPR
jgi:hypothetical protein